VVQVRCRRVISRAMKKPASAAASVHKKPSAKIRVVHKKTKNKGARKDIETGLTRFRQRPISEFSPKDFLFFAVPAGIGCFRNLRGCKSFRKGHMFEHVDFNLFADHDIKIPKNAKRQPLPPQDWLSEFFWDPLKRRLLPDPTALPLLANGTAYRIEDNGGMPFICYVRDSEVSVFRIPKDGYVREADYPNVFDAQRLLYIEEVVTFANVIKTWIGVDTSDCREHGNSIIVHVPPSSKGKIVTVTISKESTNLLVNGVGLAGEQVFSVKLDLNVKVSTLASQFQSSMQCTFVKCFGSSGECIPHDNLLSQYEQLVVKDTTQSYVCISGREIYSFNLNEEVTAYYSMVGNSSVPYPVALTATSALYMLDYVQVPREEISKNPLSDEAWGDSYSIFYEKKEQLTRTRFANLTFLCQ